VLRGGPRTRRFAFYKALIEGGLFLYMVPFVVTVCIWFVTAEGFNPFVKAAKCFLELPSLFFQCMWALACTKYWQMLCDDGARPASALAVQHITSMLCLSERAQLATAVAGPGARAARIRLVCKAVQGDPGPARAA
jgi:hypothetical protein